MTPSLPEFLNWLVELGFIEESKKTSVQKKINKVQIFILDLMNMSPVPHSSFIDNIVFLCNKYELDEKVKRQSLDLGELISKYGGDIVYQGRSPRTISTMLIAIVLVKEDQRKDCNELLKELKITSMIIRKILVEIIETIDKQNASSDEISSLKKLLLLL